jgi:hypothetical protein
MAQEVRHSLLNKIMAIILANIYLAGKSFCKNTYLSGTKREKKLCFIFSTFPFLPLKSGGVA